MFENPFLVMIANRKISSRLTMPRSFQLVKTLVAMNSINRSSTMYYYKQPRNKTLTVLLDLMNQL